MTDLSSLRSQLNDEVKIDKNDKLWSPTTKNQFLNQAYFQVQKDLNFKTRQNQAAPYTIPTVTGTQEYALPSDFIRVQLVTWDGQKIYPIDYIHLKSQNLGMAQGKPYEYYLYGGNIGFYPIPSTGTGLLYYLKRLPLMTASQDSVLPSDFDLAVVKYAAYLLWSTPRGNRQTAQEKVTDYEQIMNTLRMAYIYEDTANMTFGIQRSTSRSSSPKSLP